ncbi:MAG: sensor domain-containing diguanylate cyclase [Thermodesulfobacteriota bacterium]
MERFDMNADTDDLVRLSYFVEMAKGIMQARTIDETLQKIMHHIGEIFTPLNWSILLKNPKSGNLNFSLVVGQNASKLRGLQLPAGEGIAGWIADTGEPLIVEDVTKDPRFSTRVDQFTGFTTHSIIGVPLKSNEKVFGVIELINKLNGEPFTSYELKVLTTIADVAAIAIEKAYYYRVLKRLATIDALTGAHNRGAFERAYAREVEMCKRYGTPLSLIMVDVDDFKSINDLHGHPAGDDVLKNLVEMLGDCVRKVDAVFRYGGDEFVILLPSTTRDQALEVKRRVQQRVDYQNSLNPAIPWRVSVGVHAVDTNGHSDVLELLDADLYREKEKKYSRNIESMEEHLEDMLQEERSKLRPKGRNRRG